MWPTRFIARLGREPRAGDWYAECCLLDLFQTNAGDIENLREHYSDEDTGGEFFLTRGDAEWYLGPIP